MKEEIIEDIKALVEKGVEQQLDDKKFNDLALRLFNYQFEKNKLYGAYCRKKKMEPKNVEKWEDILSVPTGIFKEFQMATFNINDAVKVFKTSGTSDPAKKGTIYLNQDALDLLNLAYKAAAHSYFFPDKRKMFGFFLMPSPETRPEMAMAYALWECHKDYVTDYVYLITPKGIDMPRIIQLLKQKEKEGEPVFISGPAFGFVYLFDAGKAQNFKFNLPPGSRMGQGGGYKGRSRELSREDFEAQAAAFFGLDTHYIMDILGLTEVNTAFVENRLYNHIHSIKKNRYKSNQPWTRTIAVNPDTLERVPKGETGLLRHYCLTNVSTVLSIQTDDLGHEIDEGFEITGRVKGTDSRGCSMAMDDIMSSIKK